jgi:hypothetical protein
MNTRNQNFKLQVPNSKTSKDNTRKRERSREKEISKKEKDEKRIEVIKKDDDLKNVNDFYKILIASHFKVLLENFVEKEIDQV